MRTVIFTNLVVMLLMLTGYFNGIMILIITLVALIAGSVYERLRHRDWGDTPIVLPLLIILFQFLIMAGLFYALFYK